ncbi:acyltransferase [uncultured Arcticibacterium sp.]|uniref:acyltransferase family protein n=1 Tax=uncultured Arcticibacterium sp. TaxID=2173042 RepID=UPI0030F627BD
MKTNYIKSLDGIRFLAVSMVLFDHWSGDRLGFPASYLGVCMFFVLSGFLITRILLAAKEKDTNLNRGHGFSLKRFYIRRTIRIFPIYYLTLAILFILNVEPVRSKIGWLASYMSNNYIAITDNWLGSVDHLWSLAVEEQFYLFFPFLILFLPLKNIQKSLLVLIVLSVLLRAYFYLSGASWIRPYVLMPTCLDAFGLGGLLGYGVYYQKEKLVNFFSKTSTLLIGTAIYVVTVLWLQAVSEGHNYVSIIFLRLSESIISVAIVGYLVCRSNTSRGILHSIFEWQPLVYIGQISYGIYIYHNFIYNAYHSSPNNPFVRVANKITSVLSDGFAGTSVKILFLYIAVILISTVSWYLIEKPINKLKHKYGY